MLYRPYRPGVRARLAICIPLDAEIHSRVIGTNEITSRNIPNRPIKKGRSERAALRFSPASSRGGTRTPDPVINSHLLYQLSYSGSCRLHPVVRLSRQGQKLAASNRLGNARVSLQCAAERVPAHRHHRPKNVPHTNLYGSADRLEAHAAYTERIGARKQLGKAKHVLQPSRGDGSYVGKLGPSRLEPRISIAPTLTRPGHDRSENHSVSIPLCQGQRHGVGTYGTERPAATFKEHARAGLAGTTTGHDQDENECQQHGFHTPWMLGPDLWLVLD
jgi:hypothetical protein